MNNKDIICKGHESEELINKIETLDDTKNINKPKKNDKTRRAISKKVEKDSDTYKVTLEFLNAILKSIDKKEITDITEFKNITRKELLKPECNQALDNNIAKVLKHFGRSKIRYDMKNKYACYVLTVIKYLTSFCGYKVVSKKTTKMTLKDTQNYDYQIIIMYSII